MALQTSCPSLLVVHDLRTLELAEPMKIPYIHESKVDCVLALPKSFIEEFEDQLSDYFIGKKTTGR